MLPHVDGAGREKAISRGINRSKNAELDSRRGSAVPGFLSPRSRGNLQSSSHDALPDIMSALGSPRRTGSSAKPGLYTKWRTEERGAVVPHYLSEGFNLETAKRKAQKREARQCKLPPLPCDNLNPNSPIARSILEKLALYRDSEDKRLQLQDRVAAAKSPRGMPTPFNTPREMSAEDSGGALSSESYMDMIERNKQQAIRISQNYRQERSHAFMDSERKKIEKAAENRLRLRQEELLRKTANSRRHEEMRLKREREEMAVRTKNATDKLAMTIHFSTIMGHFLKYAKELTVERIRLREANLAAQVIQRKAVPWVQKRRAQKEAWALEVISRAFRKYVKSRMLKKKKEATAAIYKFLKVTSKASTLINTLQYFRMCVINMQRFLRKKHAEISARRKVDMRMWNEWEDTMMDNLRGKKKKKPKKQKKGARSITTVQKQTFDTMGGFGAVDPKAMKPIPNALKAALLRHFRRSRKVAAWKALTQHHDEMKTWEEEWDLKANAMRDKAIEEGLRPESKDERDERKQKEKPPQKQTRKLLAYSDISTLHNIGLQILRMINITSEDIEKFGLSLQADLSEQAFSRIQAEIDTAAEALTLCDKLPQNFADVVVAALKKAAEEERQRKLQGIVEEDDGSDDEEGDS